MDFEINFIGFNRDYYLNNFDTYDTENVDFEKFYKIILVLKPKTKNNAKTIDFFFNNYKNIRNQDGFYYLDINNDLFTNLDENNEKFLDYLLKNDSNKTFNKNMWWKSCRYNKVPEYFKNKQEKSSFPKSFKTDKIRYNFNKHDCYIELNSKFKKTLS